MSRLLSYVTPGWRRRGALRPRILDVRVAGARLRAALHDLAVFADATLANAHDAQDKGKNHDVFYTARRIKTSIGTGTSHKSMQNEKSILYP